MLGLLQNEGAWHSSFQSMFLEIVLLDYAQPGRAERNGREKKIMVHTPMGIWKEGWDYKQGLLASSTEPLPHLEPDSKGGARPRDFTLCPPRS